MKIEKRFQRIEEGMLSDLGPMASLQKYPFPQKKKKNLAPEDFPDGPVVKTLPSKEEGAGLIPSQGAQIPHALRLKKQNIKQKQCCDKFN